MADSTHPNGVATPGKVIFSVVFPLPSSSSPPLSLPSIGTSTPISPSVPPSPSPSPVLTLTPIFSPAPPTPALLFANFRCSPYDGSARASV